MPGADRSPGEFYQLDMEMAFASQEDVFSIVEQVLPPVFEKYGIYKNASKAPFVRIPYLEAMDNYGSDKPDLRIDLVLTDATEVMQIASICLRVAVKPSTTMAFTV